MNLIHSKLVSFLLNLNSKFKKIKKIINSEKKEKIISQKK